MTLCLARVGPSLRRRSARPVIGSGAGQEVLRETGDAAVPRLLGMLVEVVSDAVDKVLGQLDRRGSPSGIFGRGLDAF